MLLLLWSRWHDKRQRILRDLESRLLRPRHEQPAVVDQVSAQQGEVASGRPSPLQRRHDVPLEQVRTGGDGDRVAGALVQEVRGVLEQGKCFADGGGLVGH